MTSSIVPRAKRVWQAPVLLTAFTKTLRLQLLTCRGAIAGALGCLLLCLALASFQGLTLYVLSKFAERYDAKTYSILVGHLDPIPAASLAFECFVELTQNMVKRCDVK